MIEHAKYGIHN